MQSNRLVTNDDIAKYTAMVESFIRKQVVKNWTESIGPGGCFNEEVMLGNTGINLADIRQHLKLEVCIALRKYNPEYRTAEGQSVKESTFVFNHLRFRVGQTMKRLVKRKAAGYGVFHSQIERVLGDIDSES